MKFITFVFLACLSQSRATAQQVRVIPEPVSVAQKAGSFGLSSSTAFSLPNDSTVRKSAEIFCEQAKRLCGVSLSWNKKVAASSNKIDVVLSHSANKKEGYTLDVNPGKITITASGGAGVFYAFQTLLQVLPAKVDVRKTEGSFYLKIPCVLITDAPRFPFRGMHLDCSRHFYPASDVRKFIDILAAYKINTFHWHLTDSHGWRLESKLYPKLTSVGAWRAERPGMPMTISPATQPDEFATYGGYYTQDEVRDIVRYAGERFITVIPEIEMPGHCTAALVAYPQYSDLNNPVPLQVPTGYPGDLKHNFCVAYDSTYVFLQNVLKETMELFPSTYIHIGGDEVRGEPWLHCPRCQRLMKEKGYTTAKELQAYFTRRIDSFVVASGRNIIGWEEILDAHVAPSSVAMAWHDQERAAQDVKKGYSVVMTPYRYTYFDFYQSDPQLEDYITYAPLFLDSVYAFTVLPPGLSEKESALVQGAEACLWTENVETWDRVEYMLLPRLLAFAEAAWTPMARKNYNRFIEKTEAHFQRFDATGTNYAKSLYNVAVRPTWNAKNKSVEVLLSNQAPIHDVRYTTNGAPPSAQSPKYHASLHFTQSTVLKTASFEGNKRLGKVSVDSFALHKAAGAQLRFIPEKGPEFLQAASKLTDAIFGTIEPYDGRWLWFTDSTLSIKIDLGKSTPVSSIRLRFMEDQVGNAFLPKELRYSLSDDGTDFNNVYHLVQEKVPQSLLRHVESIGENNIGKTARFIRIEIANANIYKDPERNLIFLDEIRVE